MNPSIFRSMTYGMFAVGVKGDERPSACIVNTVVQITSSPIQIAVSINHGNYTNECIKKTGEFTVSVLSEDTSGTIIGALGFNSGRDTDKLTNVRHKILREGLPVLREDICCWFLCKVVNTVETCSHTIFIAEVTSGSDKATGNPMTYDYYHRVIKGKAPKAAPTYQTDEYDKTGKEPYDKYICTICGYVYDDPTRPFEELPDEWVCPICKNSKSVFKII